MRNMKKDMGGAAHAIALAELVMARRLPLRITLLVPAVENAIGPDSYRPGEVIATRKGMHVEIDNTDAEGRVILGDALTYAGEQSPRAAARFRHADRRGAHRAGSRPAGAVRQRRDVARHWLDAGQRVRDPLWRMPLWRPYLRYLTSNVAELANSGPSKMAGSITAALYLECFVPQHNLGAPGRVRLERQRPPRPSRRRRSAGTARGVRDVEGALRGLMRRFALPLILEMHAK